MIIENNNSDFNILIIDNNKEFNTKIYSELLSYKYTVTQSFNEKEAFNNILKNKDKLDLVILNIDFDDQTTTKIFEHIQSNTEAKIILLSSEDIGEKREEYFKNSILDYHLTSQKIQYIVDDILESIEKLITNKKETILIIDQSVALAESMKNILEIRNYNVFIAHNAKEGIEILRNEEISLLVLDMELPDINGLDLLEGLRDLFLLNEFLVLAISAKNYPSLMRDTLKGGASNILKKPFLYEEFVLSVDLLVNSSREKKTISYQKRKIENSLKSFKELVDSTIGAMFIFKKNICVNCNNEAMQILGYRSKEDVISKEIFEIFTNVSDEHKDELLDNTIDHDFEDKLVSCDGKAYDVQIKERNVLIDSKVLKIITALDITQVKQNEKILSQQSKMASMGEMIGNIAHQWRQPLTAISVAAGGIKLNYEFDMEDRDETIHELDNIVKNTQFLSSTIEDFQNFLKNDRATTQFSIHDTVKKTIAIINANLHTHDIKVIENFDERIQINGIQNDLMQVLLNIINNASDILKTKNSLDEEKYILIDAFVENNEVVITVQDSGGGIPEDIIDKVFEPYFTTKHQSQGTGLGLYMTHQIIEKLGGKISVSNESFVYNEKNCYGAKFRVIFPYRK